MERKFTIKIHAFETGGNAEEEKLVYTLVFEDNGFSGFDLLDFVNRYGQHALDKLTTKILVKGDPDEQKHDN